MDGTLVFHVVLFMAIPVAFVSAFNKFRYELNTARMDNQLEYIQIINQLSAKEEATDWDRKMERELAAKYKELFYLAFDTQNKHKHDDEHNRVRQMVMQYVHKNHPMISRQLLQEIKGLQTTKNRVPADWRQIMAQSEQVKEGDKKVEGETETQKDIKENLILKETNDYVLPSQKLH